MAFHAGLFNIGGEGQAYASAASASRWRTGPVDEHPAGVAVMLPLMMLARRMARPGFMPAALQAWRGSHVVITTIMFNFIASAFLSWLLVNVLKGPAT